MEMQYMEMTDQFAGPENTRHILHIGPSCSYPAFSLSNLFCSFVRQLHILHFQVVRYMQAHLTKFQNFNFKVERQSLLNTLY